MNSYNTLFRTKLNLPFSQRSLVLRTRVINDLNQALRVKLTLVTTPPGYGKTTAVTCWARQAGIPVAWFSIDSHDKNMKIFWSYVIAAFEKAIPGVEGMFSREVYTADHVKAEALVAALVDEISKSETEFVLVLCPKVN